MCLPGESVRGCFCSDDMSVYFGESVCLVCTLQELTPLVTFLISFFNQLTVTSSKFMRTTGCFAGTVLTSKEEQENVCFLIIQKSYLV